MANILILGGGFGGVMAAESVAKQLGEEHQITLISRSRRFLFYPELVRLAFGKCEPDDISFDLREAMLDRRIRFIEGEVARVDPYERRITMAHGEVEGDITYDYLIFALGRRLATEQITGFFEHDFNEECSKVRRCRNLQSINRLESDVQSGVDSNGYF